MYSIARQLLFRLDAEKAHGLGLKAIEAAYRSGLRQVMMPATNEKDLREVPAAVRERMRFIFVSTMDEVLGHLLLAATPLTLADDAPIGDADELPPRSGPAGHSHRELT